MTAWCGKTGPSRAGSSPSRRGDPDEVPEVVKRAHVELEQMIRALAEDEAPVVANRPEPKAVATETRATTPDPPRRSLDRPAYLIISSKQALTRKYGVAGFEQVEEDLQDLRRTVEERAGLLGVVAYVDDEDSLDPFGVEPAETSLPGEIKRVIDEMDARLGQDGSEIQYLLIAGGDDIIPFHRLPNPVDDQDAEVASDNPYACRDGNHLVPERAVGRLPDGATGSVGLLHAVIRTSAEAHRRRAVSKGLLDSISSALKSLRRTGIRDGGLGYSASIWRKASRAVFQVIGHDGHLRMCPPLTYEGFRVGDPPHFSYFNLHGIEDGPNWYGQRDALFPADYPLFPLALRPQDPSIVEHANAVVFTEACYGANILGKREGDSIALSLLAARALAVVGSTKVSYGSISPPLLGADLVGKHFWEGLQAHLTVGEALRHAKVTMASEMHERQGYLDDEDQKALLSFVLYGDPSLPITSIQGRTAARAPRDVLCPPIICSKTTDVQRSLELDELVASVRARIETSLPHMSHAKIRARPLSVCSGDCEGSCSIFASHIGRQPGLPQQAKGVAPRGRGWSVTLKKDIAVKGDGAHHQIVKVAVDERGRILRVALSK